MADGRINMFKTSLPMSQDRNTWAVLSKWLQYDVARDSYDQKCRGIFNVMPQIFIVYKAWPHDPELAWRFFIHLILVSSECPALFQEKLQYPARVGPDENFQWVTELDCTFRFRIRIVTHSRECARMSNGAWVRTISSYCFNTKDRGNFEPCVATEPWRGIGFIPFIFGRSVIRDEYSSVSLGIPSW